MPRKKLIRRFEPRYGVTQEMLALESKYVAREVEDNLLLSANDLSQRLSELRGCWRQADEIAERLIGALGDRQALAFQCLIVRDFYHLLELYCRCLQSTQPEGSEALKRSPAIAKERELVKEEKKVPFSEWLF